MTRTEVIAQIDTEIGRLERVRDILAAPLSDFMNRSSRKTKTMLPAKKWLQLAAVVGPTLAATRPAAPPPAVPSATPLNLQPQVQHVPPKRRMERRHTEKPGKPTAALGGLVPAGPVAVSANEARKVQERSVAPPPVPMVSEARPEIGAERSLASLIQAFERRAGVSGI